MLVDTRLFFTALFHHKFDLFSYHTKYLSCICDINMIDEIEIVISETDSLHKVCYSNTGISQLETVYKQTPAYINIH